MICADLAFRQFKRRCIRHKTNFFVDRIQRLTFAAPTFLICTSGELVVLIYSSVNDLVFSGLILRALQIANSRGGGG